MGKAGVLGPLGHHRPIHKITKVGAGATGHSGWQQGGHGPGQLSIAQRAALGGQTARDTGAGASGSIWRWVTCGTLHKGRIATKAEEPDQ